MRRLATVVTTALLFAGNAWAQDPMAPPSDPMAPPTDPMAPPPPAGDMGTTGTMTVGANPAELTRRGVQYAGGTIAIEALVGANLSKDFAFKPVIVSPDVYFALNDQLQIGIVHTSPLRWQTPAYLGTSLCLTGTDNECDRVYNTVGLDILFGLINSATGGGMADLSAHVSYFVSNITDPFESAVGLGVKGKLHFSDVLALQFDPQVYIGVTERDGGNKESLFVPVELQFQASPMIGLALQTAIWAPFKDFGDFYQVPVGLMALYNVSPALDVGLRFSFDNLLGADLGAGRADIRTLGLVAALRL